MAPFRLSPPLSLIILFGLLISVGAYLLISEGPEDSGNTEKIDPMQPVAEDELLPERGAKRSTEISNTGDQNLLDLETAADGSGHSREGLLSSMFASRITGTIESETGETIAQANIFLEPAYPEAMQTILPFGDYRTDTLSDPSGRFSIPVPLEGAFSLRIEKSGYAPHLVDFVLPGDRLELVLQKGVELSGFVACGVDEAPLPDALICANLPPVYPSGRTDEKGAFLLQDLPEGTIDLTVFAAGYDLRRIDALLLHKDQKNYLEIFLEEGAPLTGLVVDSIDHQAIPGAQVRYLVGTRRNEEMAVLFQDKVSTDHEGIFYFENVSRKGYRLEVSAQGYAAAFCKPFKEVDDPSALMKIELHRESAVSGCVFDPDGNPVDGATVRLLQQDLWEKKEIQGRTDASGSFLLEPVDPGEIRLYVAHSRYAPLVSDSFSLQPGERYDQITLYLTNASSINGTVLAPDGSSVQDAQVVLEGIKPRLIRYFDLLPLDYSSHRGGFAFDNLPAGDYRITANQGELRSPGEEVCLLEGEELTLNIEMQNGLQVSGVVQDPIGTPVNSVLVSAYALQPSWTETQKKLKQQRDRGGKGQTKSGTKPVESFKISAQANPYKSALAQISELGSFRGCCRSDSEGGFLIHGILPEDSIALVLEKSGYLQRTLSGILPSSEDLFIMLNPCCRLEGRIIDGATLAPVTTFTVTIEHRKKKKSSGPEGDPDIFIFHSEDGSFFIDSLKPGPYDLWAQARKYQASRPARLLIEPGGAAQFVDIFLELSGNLKGKVLASNHSPLAGIQVFLRARMGGAPTTARRPGSKKKAPKHKVIRGRTRDDGHFIFRDLKPGNYEIVLGNFAHPAAKPKQVQVKKGETSARAFILPDLGFIDLKIEDDSGFSLISDLVLSGGPTGIFLRMSTDNLGCARLLNLVPGKYKLRVECPKHKTIRKALMIKSGKNSPLTLTLPKHPKK